MDTPVLNTNQIAALTTSALVALTFEGSNVAYDPATLSPIPVLGYKVEPFVPGYGSYTMQQGYDVHALSFSKALAALKHGYSVRRVDWQHMKKWIRMRDQRIAVYSSYHEWQEMYIPSQEDILATDWQLLITGV